ncbi:MAG: hypothetical protein SVM86_05580 [Candidatus Cloacimonadota bacterium]|nr:hypothetical protein [Candidatus Cloacimonadota bacterium]
MKKIFVALLIVLAALGTAEVHTYEISRDDIYLEFNNVAVNMLEFTEADMLKAKGSNFQMKEEDGVVKFTAAEKTKIDLALPLGVTYHLQIDDGKYYFNDEVIVIKGEDGELVRIVEGELQVIDPKENFTVKINQEGILVWDEDDDKFVKISSEGIFVQQDGTEEEKNGFILKLVGGIVNSVADLALDELKKNRSEIIKEIINREFR